MNVETVADFIAGQFLKKGTGGDSNAAASFVSSRQA